MRNTVCDSCNLPVEPCDVAKVTFRLSDGSKLVAAMHKECADKIVDTDFDALYKNICAGWERELTASTMADDIKQNVRNKYYGCYIKRLLTVQ